MNILVVGGAGYIGSITCRELAKAGFNPIVFDSLEKGHKEAVADFELIVGETQNIELLKQTLCNKKIEAVIHFAAYIEMGESMQNPQKYFFNNFYGSMCLFKAMLEAGVKSRFSSSAGVYGQPKKLPIKEDTPRKPNNPYGESKKMVEDLLSWYDKIYNFRSISLRYFNACGAALDGSLGENHQPESHLIPNLLKAVLKNKEFYLFGSDYPTFDGTCIRDYIHVVDLAQAHILALKALNQGHLSAVYNLGAGKGYSNKEIIKKVEKITGKKVKVKIKPRRPGDVPELVADAAKFQREFCWKPKYSNLKTIISSAWKWQQRLTTLDC